MLKSKKFTLGIVVLILIYEISTTITSLKTNTLFYTLINPIFWVFLTILIASLTKGLYTNHKFKKDIIQCSLISVLIYIILYLLLGLLTTFGKNPYVTNFEGMLYNIFNFSIVIIAKEYIRYKLINNVYEKDKVNIAILISIIYIIIDFNFYSLFTKSHSVLYIYKEFSQRLLPCISKNILFSYLAINSDYKPAILYELTIKLYFLCSPILAKTPWIVNSIIDILTPIILFLYIRYIISQKDIFKAKSRIVEFRPREIIIFLIVLVMAVSFTIGLFPVRPVGILTASMEKTICIGDMVLIQKCRPEDVKVNDVIEYKLDGISIIHRVIEIQEIDDKLCFVTKGDNNKDPDGKLVEESQIVGKAILNIKYLGYIPVWLHSLQSVSN